MPKSKRNVAQKQIEKQKIEEKNRHNVIDTAQEFR